MLAELSSFLAQEGHPVALWQLDSQQGHSKEAESRQVLVGEGELQSPYCASSRVNETDVAGLAVPL